MKKVIILFFLIIVRVSLYAQEELEYRPFVEEGKVWNMFYKSNEFVDVVPDYEFKYFIGGDTLIAGQNCKKFYSFNEHYNNQTEYKMALHESEGKVYFIPSGSTESYILYDFTIPVGTSTVISSVSSPESNIEMRNNKNGIARTNGISRHCLLVNKVDVSIEDFPSGWWIEGIGSELGPLYTWQFGATGNIGIFLNCEVNGETVFNMTDFKKGEYYPEGTKWTEIRLDTLKYDNWYSEVGNEWAPNFETIEYYVQGEYLERYDDVPLKCVYTNGPTWTDSLSLLVRERMYDNMVEVNVPLFYEDNWGRLLTVPSSPEIYQFDWSVGKGLYYRDLMDFNSTGAYPYLYYYGVINEIKEGDFGGVRPLKYVDLDGRAPYDPQEPGNTDTKGGRIIQGIGITEWNDGECLFGPPNPYLALSNHAYLPERHYRSMLVHFERNGEVLYDVWPEKPVASEPVAFTAGQIATIILPTAPDASKGKYYRLDRYEDGQIIFEQEIQPQAHIPYIIVPNEDFSIDLSTLDLAGCYRDTVSVDGISFIGSYVSETFDYPDGFYIDFIDITHDCRFDEYCVIGALRAYLLVRWDDPYNQGGTRVPPLNKRGIVLRDYETGITSPLGETGEATLYDLQGRMLPSKPAQGIYIKNRQKVMVK